MTETEKLIEALKLALHALNEAPNSSIRHERYRNTYEVAAEVGRVLREMQP